MPNQYSRPFNPNGVMAYLITFRCYGTWFHGDERGSMDRSEHNTWGEPVIPPNKAKAQQERVTLKNSPFTINDLTREIVTQTIHEVCEHREWSLIALNVQSDHVHLVLSADQRPEKVMNSLKSWTTRRLRENNLVGANQKVWSRHGSTKWLWTQDQIAHAYDYVIEGQPLPPGM
jgi:REP element-mobilizing transposase RayT